MTIQEFMQSIKEEYNKRFPASLCVVQLDHNIYPSINSSCYIAQNREECPSGYFLNDILHLSFMVDNSNKAFPRTITEADDLPEIVTLIIHQNHYNTKPENRYMAFGSRKIPCRKASGTPEKIIKTLAKYFDITKTMLQSDMDAEMIHPEHVELLTRKLFQ